MKATQKGQKLAGISSPEKQAIKGFGRTLEWMADYFAERSKGGTIQAVLSEHYLSHVRPDKRTFYSLYKLDYGFIRQIGVGPCMVSCFSQDLLLIFLFYSKTAAEESEMMILMFLMVLFLSFVHEMIPTSQHLKLSMIL